MLKSVPSHSPARGEAGFTLIEVLVAAAASVVVVGAASAILVIALHQSSRISDRVQATQLGDIAMTKLVSELRSACLNEKFAPVQAESSGYVLVRPIYAGFSGYEKSEPSMSDYLPTLVRGIDVEAEARRRCV